jgi:hypothetical protein
VITSAAYAVTLSARRRRDRTMSAYALITLIFAVTTVANMSEFLRAAVPAGVVNIIANEPDERDQAGYLSKWQEERDANRVPDDQPVVFLEVSVAGASEFGSDLHVG